MFEIQEKERAFNSELGFLSRLGYCENDEKLLVYEYMKNGSLHDHLHNYVEKGSLLNSWKMRMKITLGAARGIQYLHNYAVPPIIHRDIKSSNILLDENWTARVSEFYLGGGGHHEMPLPLRAAETVGYIDPECCQMNTTPTTKSRIYGFRVVLSELLKGKRAIFKGSGEAAPPFSLVDFAIPEIVAARMGEILDQRVGLPAVNQVEAVQLVAYIAMLCVNLEGKDRPTVNDVVAHLECALSLCGDSHGSISSASISVGSD